MTGNIIWIVWLLILGIINGVCLINETSPGAKIFSLVAACLCFLAIGLRLSLILPVHY